MTNRQRKKDSVMSSVAATAERMIKEAMAFNGVKKPEARRIVARKLEVKPGALERLCAGRLVNTERLALRIDAYLGERLARKADEIEKDLKLYREKGLASGKADVDRAAALLEEARRALTGRT